MEQLSYIIHKTLMVAEPSFFKVILTAILSVIFFMFGSLYTEALIAVAMLMLFDTILGVMSAYVNGEAISSKKFGRSVLKGIVYFMGISAGYFVDLTVPFDVIQAMMIAFIGVTEFISILENIGKMGYETPNRLLNNLKEYRDNK